MPASRHSGLGFIAAACQTGLDRKTAPYALAYGAVSTRLTPPGTD